LPTVRVKLLLNKSISSELKRLMFLALLGRNCKIAFSETISALLKALFFALN
jgi:hypothetical protein